MKNQFFDAEIANQAAILDRIEMLVKKIEEDPQILYTLELWELENVKHYYDEVIRKNEEELAYLRNPAT